MKTQKIVSHKEVDDSESELDQYISETCNCCGEELIRTDDIFVGKIDNNYYCGDCAKYYNIDVVECKDIN